MAEGRIPGIPSNLRILLLGQTRIESNDPEGGEDSGEENSTTTVLQYVLRSIVQRERALKEAKSMSNYSFVTYVATNSLAVLSKALDDTEDSTAAVKAYRQIKYERSKRHLFIQQRIAARRSGARGKNARKD